MYCKHCGKQIEDDSCFCKYCGEKQDTLGLGTYFGPIGRAISKFIEIIIVSIQRVYSKIRLPKIVFSSKAWATTKKWLKRTIISTIILIAVCLVVLLGFWLYGFYQISKWNKEDERREAIALGDISKADEIARTIFTEYANNSHYYEFDGSRCDFNHIERGIMIIRIAAEKGDPRAQFTLGCIYYGARYDSNSNYIIWDEYTTMMNTEINHERAAYWWNQAAIQGDVSAMANLAIAYRDGSGVESDLYKATELMRVAAEKGNAIAQLNYGDMFRDGEVCFKVESDSLNGKSCIIHTEPDIEMAKKWWKKALENGNESAKERLEKIYD